MRRALDGAAHRPLYVAGYVVGNVAATVALVLLGRRWLR
jgi:hypothetical protein